MGRYSGHGARSHIRRGGIHEIAPHLREGGTHEHTRRTTHEPTTRPHEPARRESFDNRYDRARTAQEMSRQRSTGAAEPGLTQTEGFKSSHTRNSPYGVQHVEGYMSKIWKRFGDRKTGGNERRARTEQESQARRQTSDYDQSPRRQQSPEGEAAQRQQEGQTNQENAAVSAAERRNNDQFDRLDRLKNDYYEGKITEAEMSQSMFNSWYDGSNYGLMNRDLVENFARLNGTTDLGGMRDALGLVVSNLSAQAHRLGPEGNPELASQIEGLKHRIFNDVSEHMNAGNLEKAKEAALGLSQDAVAALMIHDRIAGTDSLIRSELIRDPASTAHYTSAANAAGDGQVLTAMERLLAAKDSNSLLEVKDAIDDLSSALATRPRLGGLSRMVDTIDPTSRNNIVDTLTEIANLHHDRLIPKDYEKKIDEYSNSYEAYQESMREAPSRSHDEQIQNSIHSLKALDKVIRDLGAASKMTPTAAEYVTSYHLGRLTAQHEVNARLYADREGYDAAGAMADSRVIEQLTSLHEGMLVDSAISGLAERVPMLLWAAKNNAEGRHLTMDEAQRRLDSMKDTLTDKEYKDYSDAIKWGRNAYEELNQIANKYGVDVEAYTNGRGDISEYKSADNISKDRTDSLFMEGSTEYAIAAITGGLKAAEFVKEYMPDLVRVYSKQTKDAYDRLVDSLTDIAEGGMSYKAVDLAMRKFNESLPNNFAQRMNDSQSFRLLQDLLPHAYLTGDSKSLRNATAKLNSHFLAEAGDGITKLGAYDLAHGANSLDGESPLAGYRSLFLNERGFTHTRGNELGYIDRNGTRIEPALDTIREMVNLSSNLAQPHGKDSASRIKDWAEGVIKSHYTAAYMDRATPTTREAAEVRAQFIDRANAQRDRLSLLTEKMRTELDSIKESGDNVTYSEGMAFLRNLHTRMKSLDAVDHVAHVESADFFKRASAASNDNMTWLRTMVGPIEKSMGADIGKEFANFAWHATELADRTGSYKNRNNYMRELIRETLYRPTGDADRSYGLLEGLTVSHEAIGDAIKSATSNGVDLYTAATHGVSTADHVRIQPELHLLDPNSNVVDLLMSRFGLSDADVNRVLGEMLHTRQSWTEAGGQYAHASESSRANRLLLTEHELPRKEDLILMRSGQVKSAITRGAMTESVKSFVKEHDLTGIQGETFDKMLLGDSYIEAALVLHDAAVALGISDGPSAYKARQDLMNALASGENVRDSQNKMAAIMDSMDSIAGQRAMRDAAAELKSRDLAFAEGQVRDMLSNHPDLLDGLNKLGITSDTELVDFMTNARRLGNRWDRALYQRSMTTAESATKALRGDSSGLDMLVHPVEASRWESAGYVRDNGYTNAPDKTAYLDNIGFEGSYLVPGKEGLSTPWSESMTSQRIEHTVKRLEDMTDLVERASINGMDTAAAASAISDAYKELGQFMSIVNGPDSHHKTSIVRTKDGRLEIRDAADITTNDNVFSTAVGMQRGDFRTNQALKTGEYTMRQALMRVAIEAQKLNGIMAEKAIRGEFEDYSAWASSSSVSAPHIQSVVGDIMRQAKETVMEKWKSMRYKGNAPSENSVNKDVALSYNIRRLGDRILRNAEIKRVQTEGAPWGDKTIMNVAHKGEPDILNATVGTKSDTLDSLVRLGEVEGGTNDFAVVLRNVMRTGEIDNLVKSSEYFKRLVDAAERPTLADAEATEALLKYSTEIKPSSDVEVHSADRVHQALVDLVNVSKAIGNPDSVASKRLGDIVPIHSTVDNLLTHAIRATDSNSLFVNLDPVLSSAFRTLRGNIADNVRGLEHTLPDGTTVRREILSPESVSKHLRNIYDAAGLDPHEVSRIMGDARYPGQGDVERKAYNNLFDTVSSLNIPPEHATELLSLTGNNPSVSDATRSYVRNQVDRPELVDNLRTMRDEASAGTDTAGTAELLLNRLGLDETQIRDLTQADGKAKFAVGSLVDSLRSRGISEDILPADTITAAFGHSADGNSRVTGKERTDAIEALAKAIYDQPGPSIENISNPNSAQRRTLETLAKHLDFVARLTPGELGPGLSAATAARNQLNTDISAKTKADFYRSIGLSDAEARAASTEHVTSDTLDRIESFRSGLQARMRDAGIDDAQIADALAGRPVSPDTQTKLEALSRATDPASRTLLDAHIARINEAQGELNKLQGQWSDSVLSSLGFGPAEMRVINDTNGVLDDLRGKLDIVNNTDFTGAKENSEYLRPMLDKVGVRKEDADALLASDDIKSALRDYVSKEANVDPAQLNEIMSLDRRELLGSVDEAKLDMSDALAAAGFSDRELQQVLSGGVGLAQSTMNKLDTILANGRIGERMLGGIKDRVMADTFDSRRVDANYDGLSARQLLDGALRESIGRDNPAREDRTAERVQSIEAELSSGSLADTVRRVMSEGLDADGRPGYVTDADRHNLLSAISRDVRRRVSELDFVDGNVAPSQRAKLDSLLSDIENVTAHLENVGIANGGFVDRTAEMQAIRDTVSKLPEKRYLSFDVETLIPAGMDQLIQQYGNTVSVHENGHTKMVSNSAFDSKDGKMHYYADVDSIKGADGKPIPLADLKRATGLEIEPLGDFQRLIDDVSASDGVLLGHNIQSFDVPVLKGNGFDVKPNIGLADTMTMVSDQTGGSYLKLGNISEATLMAGKTGKSTAVQELWGRITNTSSPMDARMSALKELLTYNGNDSAITRDTYMSAQREGHVLYNEVIGKQKSSRERVLKDVPESTTNLVEAVIDGRISNPERLATGLDKNRIDSLVENLRGEIGLDVPNSGDTRAVADWILANKETLKNLFSATTGENIHGALVEKKISVPFRAAEAPLTEVTPRVEAALKGLARQVMRLHRVDVQPNKLSDASYRGTLDAFTHLLTNTSRPGATEGAIKVIESQRALAASAPGTKEIVLLDGADKWGNKVQRDYETLVNQYYQLKGLNNPHDQRHGGEPMPNIVDRSHLEMMLSEAANTYAQSVHGDNRLDTVSGLYREMPAEQRSLIQDALNNPYANVDSVVGRLTEAPVKQFLDAVDAARGSADEMGTTPQEQASWLLMHRDAVKGLLEESGSRFAEHMDSNRAVRSELEEVLNGQRSAISPELQRAIGDHSIRELTTASMGVGKELARMPAGSNDIAARYSNGAITREKAESMMSELVSKQAPALSVAMKMAHGLAGEIPLNMGNLSQAFHSGAEASALAGVIAANALMRAGNAQTARGITNAMKTMDFGIGLMDHVQMIRQDPGSVRKSLQELTKKLHNTKFRDSTSAEGAALERRRANSLEPDTATRSDTLDTIRRALHGVESPEKGVISGKEVNSANGNADVFAQTARPNVDLDLSLKHLSDLHDNVVNGTLSRHDASADVDRTMLDLQSAATMVKVQSAADMAHVVSEIVAGTSGFVKSKGKRHTVIEVPGKRRISESEADGSELTKTMFNKSDTLDALTGNKGYVESDDIGNTRVLNAVVDMHAAMVDAVGRGREGLMGDKALRRLNDMVESSVEAIDGWVADNRGTAAPDKISKMEKLAIDLNSTFDSLVGGKDAAQVGSDFIVVHHNDVGDARYVTKGLTESVWDTHQRVSSVGDNTTLNLKTFSDTGEKVNNSANRADSLIAKDFMPDKVELDHIMQGVLKATGQWNPKTKQSQGVSDVESMVRSALTMPAKARLSMPQAETVLALRQAFGREPAGLSDMPRIMGDLKSKAANLQAKISARISDIRQTTLDTNNAMENLKLAFDVARNPEIQGHVAEMRGLLDEMHLAQKNAVQEYGTSVENTPYMLLSDAVSQSMGEVIKHVDAKHIAKLIVKDEALGKRARELVDEHRVGVRANVEGKYTKSAYFGSDTNASTRDMPTTSFENPDSWDYTAIQQLFKRNDAKVHRMLETVNGFEGASVRHSMDKAVSELSVTIPRIMEHTEAAIQHLQKYAMDDVPDNTDYANAVMSMSMVGKLGQQVIGEGGKWLKLTPRQQTESTNRLSFETGESRDLLDTYDPSKHALGDEIATGSSSIPKIEKVPDIYQAMDRAIRSKNIYSMGQLAGDLLRIKDTTMHREIASRLSRNDVLDGMRRILSRSAGDAETSAIQNSVRQTMLAQNADVEFKAPIHMSNEQATTYLATRKEDSPWNKLVDSVIEADRAQALKLPSYKAKEAVVDLLSSGEARPSGSPEADYLRQVVASYEENYHRVIDTGSNPDTHIYKWAKDRLNSITGSTNIPEHFYAKDTVGMPDGANNQTAYWKGLRDQASTWDGKSVDDAYWAKRKLEATTDVGKPSTLKEMAVRKQEEILAKSPSGDARAEARTLLREMTGTDYPTNFGEQYKKQMLAPNVEAEGTHQFFDPSLVKSSQLSALRQLAGSHIGKGVDPGEFITKMHLVGQMVDLSPSLFPYQSMYNSGDVMGTVTAKVGNPSDIANQYRQLANHVKPVDITGISDPTVKALADGFVTNDTFKNGRWEITFNDPATGKTRMMDGKPEHMVYAHPDLTPHEVIANNSIIENGGATDYGFIPVKHIAHGIAQAESLKAHVESIAEKNANKLIDDYKRNIQGVDPAGDPHAKYNVVLGQMTKTAEKGSFQQSVLKTMGEGRSLLDMSQQLTPQDIAGHTQAYKDYIAARDRFDELVATTDERHKEFANLVGPESELYAGTPEDLSGLSGASKTDIVRGVRDVQSGIETFNQEMSRFLSEGARMINKGRGSDVYLSDKTTLRIAPPIREEGNMLSEMYHDAFRSALQRRVDSDNAYSSDPVNSPIAEYKEVSSATGGTKRRAPRQQIDRTDVVKSILGKSRESVYTAKASVPDTGTTLANAINRATGGEDIVANAQPHKVTPETPSSTTYKSGAKDVTLRTTVTGHTSNSYVQHEGGKATIQMARVMESSGLNNAVNDIGAGGSLSVHTDQGSTSVTYTKGRSRVEVELRPGRDSNEINIRRISVDPAIHRETGAATKVIGDLVRNNFNELKGVTVRADTFGGDTATYAEAGFKVADANQRMDVASSMTDHIESHLTKNRSTLGEEAMSRAREEIRKLTAKFESTGDTEHLRTAFDEAMRASGNTDRALAESTYRRWISEVPFDAVLEVSPDRKKADDQTKRLAKMYYSATGELFRLRK